MNENDIRAWRWPALVIVVVLGIIIFWGPLVAFVVLVLKTHVHPADKTPLLSVTDFLSAGAWLQALVAWLTSVVAWFSLAIIGFGGYQVVLLKSQTALERERLEREDYRRLITPEMQSAKRLLHDPEIQDKLHDLDRWLTAAANEATVSTSEQDERCRNSLDELRKEVDEIATRISFPLLGHNKASFDHLEALINEYNYLSKLIEDGKQKKEFATDMALANFQNVYVMVKPIIKLRRKISKNAAYASHFSRHCGDPA